MTIQKLRDICQDKLLTSRLNKDSKAEANFKSIQNILEYDDAFNKLHIDVAVNILLDLGFNLKDCKKIFKSIISNNI